MKDGEFSSGKIIALLLIALSALAAGDERIDAAPPQKKSSGKPGVMTVQIPPGLNLGKVHTLMDGWSAIGTECLYAVSGYREATGRLVLPASKKYALEGSEELMEHPEALRAFAPSTLACLSLNRLSVSGKLLEEAARLTSLNRIELEYTDANDKDILRFVHMPDLQALSLEHSYCRGTFIPAFARTNRLRWLDLTSLEMSADAFTKLPLLSQLEHLVLVNLELTDADLQQVAKMKSLIDLRISHNKHLTSESMNYIASMPRLKVLDMTDTQYKFADVMKLKEKHLILISASTNHFTEQERKRMLEVFKGTQIMFIGKVPDKRRTVFTPLN